MRRLLIVLAILGLLIPAVSQAVTATAALTWGAVTGADSYVVERKVGTAAYAVIGTPTAANFTDAGLTLGTAYCYRVSAKNAVGTSTPSNEACATTGNTPGVPGSLTVIFTYVP